MTMKMREYICNAERERGGVFQCYALGVGKMGR